MAMPINGDVKTKSCVELTNNVVINRIRTEASQDILRLLIITLSSHFFHSTNLSQKDDVIDISLTSSDSTRVNEILPIIVKIRMPNFSLLWCHQISKISYHDDHPLPIYPRSDLAMIQHRWNHLPLFWPLLLPPAHQH